MVARSWHVKIYRSITLELYLIPIIPPFDLNSRFIDWSKAMDGLKGSQNDFNPWIPDKQEDVGN